MRMRISKAVPQERGLRSLKSTVWWLPLSIYYPNTVHFFNLEGYANTHVHLYVPQRCCTLYGTREFELLGTSEFELLGTSAGPCGTLNKTEHAQ